MSSPRLLIKFPTRHRFDKFFHVLRLYQNVLAKESTRFLITLDADDVQMNRPEALNVLKKYGNVMVEVGRSDNKIHACNRDLEKYVDDFDIILLASDDMIPVRSGIDHIICEAMKEHYPDTDGALWFSDGKLAANQNCNTLLCCGKKYYQRFGYLYNPLYKSFFSDNEYTEVAQRLKKIFYLPDPIIEHHHPMVHPSAKSDHLYARNNIFWDEDKETYKKRKLIGFGLNGGFPEEKKNDPVRSPEPIIKTFDDEPSYTGGANMESEITITAHPRPLLEILIPSLEKRKRQLKSLLQKLDFQKRGFENEVLISTFTDAGEYSTGYKRNYLLQRATGEYECFLDDDDDVSDNYIPLLVNGCKLGRDCVSLSGIITTDGRDPRTFIHSLRYGSWFEKDKVYYRPPNHLNCIKTDIAKGFKFPDVNLGEDHDFSMQLQKAKVLKSEAVINQPYYFYQYKTRK